MVLSKIYVVYFLVLLLVISYVCEKLFGCHIQLIHEDVLLYEPNSLDHQNPLKYTPQSQYSQYQSIINTDLKITLIQLLPLRLISRMWGYINQIPLPQNVRKPLFLWYSRTFGCNLKEIETEDLSQFCNLSEFFRRSLKPNARIIDTADGVVSNFLMNIIVKNSKLSFKIEGQSS